MKSSTNLFFTGIIIFLFNSANAQWSQTSGPGGGPIASLLVKGSDVFAASQYGSMHRSSNGGISWVNLGLISEYQSINALATDGSIILAGSAGAGIFFLQTMVCHGIMLAL